LSKDKIACLSSGIRVFSGSADIAIEVPASMFAGKVIEAWAAAYRSRTSVRRTDGPAARTQIQRLADPLADGSKPDQLRLDISVPSGYPNGRRLTDDANRGAALETFPYLVAAPKKAARPISAETPVMLAASYIQKLRETGDGGYLDRAGKLLDGVLAKD